MKYLLNTSLITPVRSLLLVAAVSLLAACGGGGGGGGGVLPTKLSVTVPAEDGTVLGKDDFVELTFVESVTLQQVQDGLSVKLGFYDVSAVFNVFEVDVDGTTVVKAKADIFALTGALKFSDGNVNYLEAGIPGSSKAKRNFSYAGSPELVVTSVTGGTHQGYDGTFEYDLDEDGIDEFYDGTLYGYTTANANGRPGNGNVLSVAGLARFAVLNALDVTTDADEVVSITGVNSDGFTITGLDYIGGQSANDLPAYTLVANGGASTLELVSPGKLLNNMLALQLNNTAFNRVIGEWLAEAIEYELGQIDSANPLTLQASEHATNGGVADAACEAVNAFKAGTDAVACDIQLIGVVDAQNSSLTPNVIVTAEVVENIAPLLDQGSWRWRVTVTVEQVVAKLRFNAYDELNSYALLGSVDFPGVLVNSAGDFTLSFDLEVGAETGAALLSLAVPADAVAIGLSELDALGNGSCTPLAFCNVPVDSAAINTQLGSYEDPATVAELEDSFQTVLADAVSSNTPSINNASIISPVTLQDPVDGEIVISAVQQWLERADYREAVSGVQRVGGLVGLQGYTKTVDAGVHLNALGSRFTRPLTAGRLVDGNISAAADVSLAVSSNWINQLLLSVYQSNVFSTVRPALTVADLGDIGAQLVSVSQGNIAAGDPVDVTIASEAVGSSRFVDADEPYMELSMPAIRLSISLPETDLSSLASQGAAFCNGGAIRDLLDGKHPYVELVMDVKARMPLRLDPLTKALDITPDNDDLMLFVASADGTEIRDPLAGCKVLFQPSRTEFQALLPELVSPLLQQELEEAVAARDSTICIDSSTLGDFAGVVGSLLQTDKVMELVLSDLAVEGEHLMLAASAREQGDAGVPGQAFFSLVLADSTSVSCQ
ncbi:MAG TPA: hypothetical protein VIN71_13705 [Pseudomonadales bacterium]